MKDKTVKGIAVSLGLITIMGIGGISAYFTDTDTQTNKFTVGRVTVDLTEPEWDKYPDKDNNGGALPEHYRSECRWDPETSSTDRSVFLYRKSRLGENGYL